LHVNEYFFRKVVQIDSHVDKQLSPAEYFVVIEHQKLQQTEIGRRESKGPAVAVSHPSGLIDANTSYA
jgi:hypothetical protein